MNNHQIKVRIAELYIALQFCSEKIKTFTTGERICINQERFQWMHILDNPEADPRVVSEALDVKIKNVTKLVLKSNFKPYYDDPFLNETEIIESLRTKV